MDIFNLSKTFSKNKEQDHVQSHLQSQNKQQKWKRCGKSKSAGVTVHTHNFIAYKVVSKTNYSQTHKNVYERQAQQNNTVYKHLKNQKVINTMLSRIFNKPKKIKTQIDMETSQLFKTRFRPKTQMSEHSSATNTFSSKKFVQNSETLKKVQSFNTALKKFHKSMVISKNKMGILDKYNNYVQQFEQKLPKDPAEQTRQSIQQNQKLIQICIQDSMTKNKKAQFKQRYMEIMDYCEPLITPDLKQRYLKRKQNSNIRQTLKKNRNK